MGCFGRRSKKNQGSYTNPAYSFNNPPPARPAHSNDSKPIPQVNYPQNYPIPELSPNPNLMAYRPSGAIPDGKGALPTYQPSSSTTPAYPPPPGPPPGVFSLPSPQQKGFVPPPPAFSPCATSPNDELPPPPAISHEISPATNTTSDLADAGYEFCTANPLFPPQQFPASALSQISTGNIPLAAPPSCFNGTISPGRLIETARKGCADSCLISALPLFAAGYHHPANTGNPRTIYFEIVIEKLPRDTAVAVGFVGCPYPGFRLPGWNRGSLGVHSDDGRRYCNDSYGGKDFTMPFREGEVVGIGMRFPVAKLGEGIEIFVKRDGVEVGMWRLDEETDAELDWSATEGLDGRGDVYAAVGVWGGGIKVKVSKFVSQ